MATRLDPLDLYDVRSLLTDEERLVQDSVGRFVDERVLPIIGDCFDQGRFPKELIPEIAGLGLLGATIPEEYGGAGMNGVSYGLICQELERGDSGLRSFASVQSSLCMYPIFAYGSEEPSRPSSAISATSSFGKRAWSKASPMIGSTRSSVNRATVSCTARSSSESRERTSNRS
jgi:hypothetical protein